MGSTVSSRKTDEAQAAGTPLVRSLHHFSFRCFDAEETRRFYEDFLGLEFCAALPVTVDLGGKKVEALQILFRMTNGDIFSFYDVPDDVRPDIYEPVGPFESHFAMKVSSEAEWDIWVERLNKAGIEYVGPLDHDFVKSVYFRDPNGIWLEITYQVPDHEEILDREESHAKEAMERWTAETAEQKAKFRKVDAAA